MSNIVVLTKNNEMIESTKEFIFFDDGKTSRTDDGLQIIEMFLSRKTANTKRTYRNSIYNFFKFLYGDTGFLTFSMMIIYPPHAIAYEKYLSEIYENNEIKASTYNGYIKGVKQFYDWLIFHTTTDSRLFEINPFAKIQQIAENDKEGSKPLTDEEIELMLNNPCTKNPHLQERNELLLELAISTGIRNTALLTLTIDEIKFIDGYWVVDTIHKGGKRAKISITSCYDRLMKWYNTDKIFRGADDNGTIFNIHPHSANRIVRDWAKSVGIKKKVTFHSLRTTTAVNIYKNTGNTFKVQRALIHTHLETTNGYLDKANEIITDGENAMTSKNEANNFDDKIKNMSMEQMKKLLLSLDPNIKAKL